MNCVLNPTSYTGVASVRSQPACSARGCSHQPPADQVSSSPASEEATPSRAAMLAFQAGQVVQENKGYLAVGSMLTGLAATVATGNPVYAFAGAVAGLGFSQA